MRQIVETFSAPAVPSRSNGELLGSMHRMPADFKQGAEGQPSQSAATKPNAPARIKERADHVRLKMRLPDLVVALEDHVLGKVDMSVSQIRVAELLLRKVLPDLPAKQDQDEASPQFKVEIVEPQP